MHITGDVSNEQMKRRNERTERSEEPSVFAAGVALLEDLLDVLLGILTLADLLEGLGRQGTLKSLQLQCVSCGHQVVVVDGLDEGLDLGALLLARLRHAPCDLGRVPLDAGHQGVAEGVCLVTAVDGLDDDDLDVREIMLVAYDLRRLWNP